MPRADLQAPGWSPPGARSPADVELGRTDRHTRAWPSRTLQGPTSPAHGWTSLLWGFSFPRSHWVLGTFHMSSHRSGTGLDPRSLVVGGGHLNWGVHPGPNANSPQLSPGLDLRRPVLQVLPGLDLRCTRTLSQRLPEGAAGGADSFLPVDPSSPVRTPR